MSRQNQTQIVGFGLFLWILSATWIINAQEIFVVPDEPITVAVGHDPVWLTYEAQANDVISITTLAQDDENPVDTTLEILYPNGQRLDYADDTVLEDGTISTDARFVDLILPIKGLYRIRVDSFNGVSDGDVLIQLTQTTSTPTEVMTTDQLTILSAKVPRHGTYHYALDVQAGQTWTIIAHDISETIDPVLRILSADGDVIAMNDDHHSNNPSLNVFDSQLSNISSENEGIWLIEVSDFYGRFGTVELIISP